MLSAQKLEGRELAMMCNYLRYLGTLPALRCLGATAMVA